MVVRRIDQSAVIAALRGATPYIRLYKGKTFVIKIGGGILGNVARTRRLLEQVAVLHHLGICVVLVHGGGPQVDEMQRSLGIEPRRVRGRRITDERSINATTMVMDSLNAQILATCRELGIDAVGLSGIDAGLVRARRRPPVIVDGESVDYGCVGDIVSIDATAINKELDAGLVPVINPLAADDAGVKLNINADTVAAAVGAALRAEKLILCTGAPGILERRDDPRSLISYTDLAGLERLDTTGSFAGGILPKALAIASAIQGGVRRAHVISYDARDSLLAEIFTNEGTGTMIVADVKELTPSEQGPDETRIA